MDPKEFCIRGKQMVDYIVDYRESLDKHRKVFPDVKPGYLRPLLPDAAPEEAESFEDVMSDMERVIMPGTTHWTSPHFHAYFPSAFSYPSLLAEMIITAINSIGFSWASCPAATELEIVMLDWLGKALQLPVEFLSGSGGGGGGVIQRTASDATLMSMLSARHKTLTKLGREQPNQVDGKHLSKLVAYMSDQAHSSVERAAIIEAVRVRKLPSDEKFSMRGMELEKAIKQDKENGLIPFYLCATLGTTSSCAFDNILELGPICQREGIWMHIDAAYAGSAFICPEFRPLLNGVEFADSFDFNAHKWMGATFDCSPMWVKSRKDIVNSLKVEPPYLKHIHSESDIITDYRHWQISLGRKFSSLKLWFVLRLFGIKKMQELILSDVAMAREFEEFVRKDERFEVTNEVKLGLVCFALKGSNELNRHLLEAVNREGKIHITPTELRSKYTLRFVICWGNTRESVRFAWEYISSKATALLSSPSE
uniref:aromatic-L-amino-acid decarboxylase-like n=1 Tax=Myxine glutinosa TaxID=7769 RepID=UPI00358EC380